ncbi:hypothetical protein [Actinocrispum wychmicini]|uniref:Uncharacterized protein n=1 Tax=Actinocrispum wychmicini TaxID=1213861 RepID=A0A4R2J7V0_9PSEU|nr:hypothetical protein [Actinocrispum wychmicini]TCO53732.1 hypothetical protein EV192_110322 [Actinocrispum wychmicini]
MMDDIKKQTGTAAQSESAALLTKLAAPVINDFPDVPLQKSLIERLEAAIKSSQEQDFDKFVLFVGAFELPVIPEHGKEGAVAEHIELFSLPSRFEAGERKIITHALHAPQNAFSLVKGDLATGLIRHSLLTMKDAHQLEYLRLSGIVGKQWKILVEIHYYRNRDKQYHSFHKDTYGETLFVNLCYDTDGPVPGPEYILNPELVDDHERQIAESLPPKFLADLKWVRSQLPKPTQINMSTIPPNGYIAFVDEALHHTTPMAGGRTVNGPVIRTFLTKHYSDAMVQDALAAVGPFREAQPKTTGEKFVSFFSPAKPFADFVKVIPKTEARKWQRLVEMMVTPKASYDRANLLDAGLTNDEIDTLFAEAPLLLGYQHVNIPLTAQASLGKPPLKREASDAALQGRVQPTTPGDRRFFRTWIRAVPADLPH